MRSCLVGIEACASAHHWSRELKASDLVDQAAFGKFGKSVGEDRLLTSPLGMVEMRKHDLAIEHVRAAEFALQFEHPKLGAIATASMSGQDFASMLERAIARSGKGHELKQIEPSAVDLTPAQPRISARA